MKSVIIAGAVMALISSVSLATIIDVPAGQPTIQEGIDAAQPGDTVLVEDGTYTGDGNRDIDFRGKPVTVRSKHGPEVTVIDCQADSLDRHRGFIFQSQEDTLSVLDGFTIQGGFSPGYLLVDSCRPDLCPIYAYLGGGILCADTSSPKILNCVLTNNYAWPGDNLTGFGGGGMECFRYSSPRIINCDFVENTAWSYGGGLECWIFSSPSLIDCNFISNTAVGHWASGGGLGVGDNCAPEVLNCAFAANSAVGVTRATGGGMSVSWESSPTVTNCSFTGNSASAEGTYVYGGGIFCGEHTWWDTHWCSLTVVNTVVSGNTAKKGAGIAAVVIPEQEYANTVTLDHCTIFDNACLDIGGGILAWRTEIAVDYCTVFGNSSTSGRGQGGGLWVGQSTARLSNSTFANCYADSIGAGICSMSDATVQIENSIIAFSAKGEGVASDDSNTPELTCSNLYGNDGGDWIGSISDQAGTNGNFSLNPFFCDLPSNDFSIFAHSPCAPGLSSCGVLVGAHDVNCCADTGSIAGIVAESQTGLLGVPVDLYDEVGLVAATVSDESGRYRFTDLSCGCYWVGIATPLGYSVDADTRQVDIIGLPVEDDFTLVTQPIAMSQRGRGYWMHQVNALLSGKGHAQETYDDMCDYMERIRVHFNEHRLNPIHIFSVDLESSCDQRLEALRAVISPISSMSMNDKAKAHLTGLLLNMVSGKVAQWAEISADGATVSQAITYCNALISDSYPENDEMAKNIADMINEGRMVPAGWIDLATPAVAYRQTGVDQLPSEFFLGKNYPNPFNPVTKISFSLPDAAQVTLRIYNVMGQRVTTLIDRHLEAGEHFAVWDGSNATSGVYFYRLESGDFVATRKMVLLK